MGRAIEGSIVIGKRDANLNRRMTRKSGPVRSEFCTVRES